MSAEDNDPLLRDYRRASADEAGRPGEATRRAILAEARAAARRRQPAANDSRYVLRAVAGVAAIGVALLVWRQMDHRLPGTPPAVAEVVASAPPAASPASVSAPERVRGEAPVLADRREKAMVSADAASDNAVAEVSEAMPSEQAAGDSPPLAAAPQVFQRADAQTAARASTGLQAPAQLLQQVFPQQYASDEPHRVWLVQDSGGNVLFSGELAAGQSLADLQPRLRRDLGDLALSWRTENIVNARGGTIELSRASLP